MARSEESRSLLAVDRCGESAHDGKRKFAILREKPLLKAEQDRGPDFLRLANALSALYPRESEEKRLLDAMLLAVPR